MKRYFQLSYAGLISLFLMVILDTVFGQVFKNKIDPALTPLYSQFGALSPTKKTSRELAKPGVPVKVFTYAPAVGKLFSVDTRNQDPEVRVIMEYYGQIEELEALGIDVQSRIGHFVTAHFPISRLQILTQRQDVGYIELGKPVELELDVSAGKVRALEARTSFGKTGQNVIIGIVDAGIDITNPDFIKSDGTTRILYIWDQTLTPVTGESNPVGYSYGVEYTQAQINNEIDGTPAGFVRTKDLGGHGTHVAGIAAGNGRATGNGIPAGTYTGMAPEGDLIIVRAKFGVGSNTADVIDGLLWIGTKAAQLGKPWVANLSIGSRWGPKDGTSNFEQAVFGVTNQTDLGKGRIIVNSSGNDGHDLSDPNREAKDRYHAGSNGPANRTIVINSGVGYGRHNEIMWMEIWYPWNDNYSVTVTSPLGSGHVYGPYGKGQGTGDPGYGVYIDDENQTDGFVLIHNEHFDTSWNPKNQFYTTTSDNLIIIIVADLDLDNDGDSDRHLRSGNWTLSLSTGAERWDAYISEGQVSDGVWFNESSYENARIISEPGNALNIITVGSFNSKNSWIDVNNNTQTKDGYPIDQISYFSSPGPTRDGRTKPDIYAPGAWIASSLSDDDPNITTNPYKARDGKHYHAMGTSASAPHVTGAVALLLQQNNNYTFDDIKSILDQSKTPQGYLDIYAALDINEEPTGIEDDIAITSGPSVVTSNSNVTYGATFYDSEPLGDYIVGSWIWQLYAYHDQGGYILASGNTSGQYSTSWNANIGTLPGDKNWVRDQNGRVAGEVVVKAKDCDNIWHEDVKDVGINAVPVAPVIYRKVAGNSQVELSFIGSGAATYKVFYDINSGVPYNGTGATQGPSPIDVGTNNSLTLTGLTNGTTYYFAIKGYNSFGESNYSSEYYATPITTYGTLSQNETWPGIGNIDTVNITGNVTIPSGKILTIQYGTTIKFAANTQLIINGNLIGSGINISPITFTSAKSNPARGDWKWIKFDNSSGTSTLEYCDIEYAEIGIWSIGSSHISMNYVSVDNCLNWGLYLLNNSNYTTVAYSSFNYVNDRGIFLFNSSPQLTHVTCSNDNYGLFCYSSSSPQVGYSTFSNNNYDGIYCYGSSSPWMYHQTGFNRGWNTINNNNGKGVIAISSSYPKLGFNETLYPGKNTIAGNGSYEIYNGNSSGYIWAIYNWWETPTGPLPGDLYTSSTVKWQPVHPPAGLLAKASQSENIVAADSSIAEKYNELGTYYLIDGQYEKAKSTFEYVITQYPETEPAKYALVHIPYCLEGLSQGNEIVTYLEGIANTNKGYNLEGFALSLSVPYLEREGNYQQAVNRCKNVRSFYQDKEVTQNLLFIMANIYFYGIKDYQQAKSYFEQFITAYPDNVMASTAKFMLEILGSSILPKKQLEGNELTGIIPDDFGLSQNYPNPFNPETEIHYQLPEDCRVVVTVYNLLGQKIRILVDKTHLAGFYSVRWDGKDDRGVPVSSGVYLYVISANQFHQVKKMLLLR